jgi:hypothetical protein
MQAYIDDSGNSTNSPIFVFGGFVAPVENWLAFSDEWKAALQTPPILDYFKMKEAARLKDQFDPRKGWTADLRDQRINEFAEIIHKHADLRVSAAIKYNDFKKYIRSIPAVNRGLAADTPYITALSLLMTAVALSRESLNLTDPVDFIFDEQEGIEEELAHFWPGIKAKSEKAINKFVRDSFQHMPLFRNEKDFLPLQAADLYAWQVRRNWNNNRSLYMPPNHALRKLWSIPGFDRVYNESEIKFMGELKRRIAIKILAFDPTLRWVAADESAKIRKANRKRAKKKPQMTTASPGKKLF